MFLGMTLLFSMLLAKLVLQNMAIAAAVTAAVPAAVAAAAAAATAAAAVRLWLQQLLAVAPAPTLPARYMDGSALSSNASWNTNESVRRDTVWCTICKRVSEDLPNLAPLHNMFDNIRFGRNRPRHRHTFDVMSPSRPPKN